MDEQPVQLLGEVREGMPMNERHCKREGSEYERKGTCSVFMFVEPLGGQAVCVRVPAKDEEGLGEGSEVYRLEQYPQTEKVVLVMDNLNTHTVSSLYEAFPAKEAFELARKLEIHYTPKHGSYAPFVPNIFGKIC